MELLIATAIEWEMEVQRSPQERGSIRPVRVGFRGLSELGV